MFSTLSTIPQSGFEQRHFKMRISEIKHTTPALELKKASPTGGSQGEVGQAPVERSPGNDDSNREIRNAPELPADPALMDLQPLRVHNDFSAKYRRAELALEGTIYRLAKLQSALLEGAQDCEGSIALPENTHLQQTADRMAMLAHIESVRFKKSI
jgi:hypothetical protein